MASKMYITGLVWFMVLNATFNNISEYSAKTTDLSQITHNFSNITLYLVFACIIS